MIQEALPPSILKSAFLVQYRDAIVYSLPMFNTVFRFAPAICAAILLANAPAAPLQGCPIAIEGRVLANNMDSAPNVTAHPSNRTVGAGRTVIFEAAATGDPTPTVQWQVSTNGGVNWADVSGANSMTYSFVASLADSGKQVRAVFTNNLGAASTNSATLTVVSTPAVACGQTITANTTFDVDLFCPPEMERAIIIGASNITLDLGGHVLSGYAPVGGVNRGIVAADVNGVTIRNGTVLEFSEGVDVFNSRSVIVEDLSVRNLRSIDPAYFIAGINVNRSSTVVVKNSQFEFVPLVHHKTAVDVYASDVTVSNIVVRGGGVGVDFSFANYTCDPVHSPNTGELLNSKITDARHGVLVACSAGARIAGNDIDCSSGPGMCDGIRSYGPFAGAVTGLRVEGNTIRNAGNGINLEGVVQSSVTNNTVTANPGYGIVLRRTQGEDGAPISYPFGNTVSGNRAWGNSIDLYDDGTGRGNTWAGNICATKQGAAIPACSGMAIVNNPSDQRVEAGQTAGFSAAATYAGYQPNFTPAVQWQVSTDGGSTWAALSGATSTTYSFTAAATDSGKRYRALFTGSNGTATTAAATLTVSTSASAPAVTVQPSSQIVPAGQLVTFSAAANGTPTPTVQWQVSADSGTTWMDILVGAISPAYSFTTWASDSGKQYRAVFNNGMGTATTNAAILTVTTSSSPPGVTMQPSNQTVPAGQAAAFYTAASGTPTPTVQWQVSVNGGSTWADVTGATLLIYTFTAAADDSGKQYRAVFTNSLGPKQARFKHDRGRRSFSQLLAIFPALIVAH